MKKTMRRNPTAIRARNCSLGVARWASRARSGSDTAATDVPNRLIGRICSSCAYCRLDAPPSPASVPSSVSMSPEICATPAPSTTGSQATSTSCTPSAETLHRTGRPRSARAHAGSCTPTCSTLPATVPHASASESRVSCWAMGRAGDTSHVPAPTSAAIPAMFQTAGAAYDRKNRRCVLRTPRHQAEITIRPDIGNNRRIKLTARARASPRSPAPNRVVSAGAKPIPTSARTPVASSRSPRIAPARARAARLSARSLSAAYTGMNDADSVPSARRLRMVLGTRWATVRASAAQPLPM